MYSLIVDIVRSVQVALPSSHFDQVFPLRRAAICSTVAGLMPLAPAYVRISVMNCSMAAKVGFLSYMVKRKNRFSFPLPQVFENRTIFL